MVVALNKCDKEASNKVRGKMTAHSDSSTVLTPACDVASLH